METNLKYGHLVTIFGSRKPKNNDDSLSGQLSALGYILK